MSMSTCIEAKAIFAAVCMVKSCDVRSCIYKQNACMYLQAKFMHTWITLYTP